MRDEGVSVIAEYMYMILILTIFLFFFLLFLNGIFSEVIKDNLEEGLKEVGNEVAEKAIYLSSLNETARVRLEIPKELGGKEYKIYWKGGNIIVEMEEMDLKIAITFPIELKGEIYSRGEPYIVRNVSGELVLES